MKKNRRIWDTRQETGRKKEYERITLVLWSIYVERETTDKRENVNLQRLLFVCRYVTIDKSKTSTLVIGVHPGITIKVSDIKGPSKREGERVGC